MRRFISAILIFTLICASSVIRAGAAVIPDKAYYMDSAARLASLGVIESVSDSSFKPEALVTRGQFAVMMVTASNLKSDANALKGSTMFSDVDPASSVSGYIAAAVNNGYILGMTDGKFNLGGNITYAQICTSAVKALGYIDEDVPGIWPKNYIDKASSLKLTEGISFKSSDGVQLWAAALIIDRLLDTDVKKASASDSDKSFADASGLFSQCIILANYATSDKLGDNEVLTDKGILYVKDEATKLNLGNTYRLLVENDTVKASYGSLKYTDGISVDGIADTKISYTDEDGKTQYKILPEKTAYYYNGVKQSYDSLKDIIQTRSSIVFAYNSDRTGYEYAVVFDPVYSSPEVANSYRTISNKIGAIDLSGLSIIKDGALSQIQDIEENDVVYQVSDIWEKYKYILVTSDKVGGKITAMLPNKLSPKTLKIDETDYSFSKDMDFSQLSDLASSLDVDDNIIAILGYDGKIVSVKYSGSQDNSEYAVVLNYSSKTVSNETFYSVKLLTSDGAIGEYNCSWDVDEFKGKLVKVKNLGNGEVDLETVVYNYPTGIYTNKNERLLNSNYVTKNVKIFNIISNNDDEDAVANILSWSDMPEGKITDGEIHFTGITGEFEDVSVILSNDILKEKYKPAIIKNITAQTSDSGVSRYSYTMTVNGEDYQYSSDAAGKIGQIGSVFKLKLSKGSIDGDSIIGYGAEKTGTMIQAFDSQRIKIDGRVYWFKNNLSVYHVDASGNVTVKTIADLKSNVTYGKISLYLDKPSASGGKVEVIVLR